MSEITAELVAMLARVWHRTEVDRRRAEGIAAMLRPMDDAAEAASGMLEFEDEPSAFETVLDEMAPPR